MEPWYKVSTPRKEVREGRSFNPDEFAIALEQVVDGTAPEDHKNPEKFFSRTFFTRALTEHVGIVLRRLKKEKGTVLFSGANPGDTILNSVAGVVSFIGFGCHPLKRKMRRHGDYKE
jgi:hypothetical protein